MMFENYAKYTANTGLGTLTTANTGLDGGGTLVTVLTPDATGRGCYIKSVTIKALATLANGDIIRLFVYNGTTNYLIAEFPFRPAGGGIGSVFSTAGQVVPLNFPLKASYTLKASTDQGKKIAVTVEALDWVAP